MPLNLDLAEIQRARDDLAQARDAERAAGAQLKAAKTAFDDLIRGGDAQAVANQQAKIASLEADARGAMSATVEQISRVKALSQDLLGQRDPSAMIEALSTKVPVMLMPVAVQTRYDDAATRLMIRIYPDALHTFGHEPGLSQSEVDEGKRYWTQRFAVPGDVDSPWQTIVHIYPPARAAWIVRVTTPTNVGEIGHGIENGANGELFAPVFNDDAIPLANRETPTVYATALPDRFVAIGYAGGKEIFRKWGEPVADLLPMSPALDPLMVDDPENHDPFGRDRAWMVRFPDAVDAGMGIVVTQADLKGAQMKGRIDRLIVLGVDWTQTPESAATLVASLLDNHQHSSGLAFVGQGTPTNNTGDVRAGFAANGADVAADLNPVISGTRAEDVAAELASAGARLSHLLGLPADVFDAGIVPGSDLVESASAGHMLNAIWNATIGYTLRYFWNPLSSAQSLLDDDAIDQLRAWCVRYLRPSGPLTALRVGKQPYGIVPVTARSYVAHADSPLERELFKAVQWFRRFWDAAIPRVPTLSNPSAENLHQVLAMQPWATAKRYWEVAGPAAIANYPDIAPFAIFQGLLLKGLIGDLLDEGLFQTKTPFLSLCAVRPKPHSIDAVPWVQRDPAQPQRELDGDVPLARNYLTNLLQLLTQPAASIRSQLVAMQNGESLLEAMLGFAADEEVLQSGHDLFYGHVKSLVTVNEATKASAQRFRPAEYIGVDTSALVGDQVDINNARAVMGLKLAGTTGSSTVEEFIGAKLGLPAFTWPEHMKNIASFNDSLAFLKDRKAGELQHAFRTTLDLFAHRLDAWITSLATRRLEDMRDPQRGQPEGIHIGAFGVVENLIPDAARAAGGRASQSLDSLGYVHAPSIQQATTASILRSGFLANRQAAGSPFDIDLRSRRVKRAKRLLEGIANGQSMAALIGYRFERSLRDAGLAQHVLEFRRAFPLRPAGDNASDEPQEAIAARDVVDGVRMIDAYRANKGGFAVPGVPAALTHQGAAIGDILDDLFDQIDSVSDLLIAESVHQMVGGNLEGAGAAMMTLDKQTRPPEPRVVETPHRTRGYTQRVVVALQSTDPGAWNGVADGDLAAQIEPRLNAWLARLFGDPSRYRFGAKVFIAPADEAGAWTDTGKTLSASLAELAMSPLSLVLRSEAQQVGGRSGVQERLATLFGAKLRADVGDDADHMAIVLQAEAPVDGGDDGGARSIGLVAFESFAWLLRRLIDKTRALRRMDMVQARDGVESDATQNDGEFAGVDLAELQGRLAIAEAAADDALAELAAASDAAPEDLSTIDPNDPATEALFTQAQGALAKAYALGWRSALASNSVATSKTSDAQGEKVRPDDSAERALARVRALRAEVSARIDDARNAKVGEGFAGQVEIVLGRIASIVGKEFPVLPTFTLGDFAGEAAATLGDRDALLAKADLGNDDTAIAGWLGKLACVREGAALLSDALTAAEALAEVGSGAGEAAGVPSDPLDFKLMQYPRGANPATTRWGALPPSPDQDLRGVVAVAAHAPGALEELDVATAIAGLFVDEWMESIPSDEETTGLGFHFDAPGARPPQSIVLAVPADPAAQNWTLDALADVVNETMALARLRAVRPQDLQGLGLILPGIFLSNNFKQDVPSIDFSKLLAKNLDVLRVTADVHGSATMAAGKTMLTG